MKTERDNLPNEINIYDKVIIIVNPEDGSFKVRNMCNDYTIANKITDKNTALAIRKAYCDGYYDASHNAENTLQYMRYIRTGNGYIIDLVQLGAIQSVIDDPYNSKELSLYLDSYGKGSIVDQSDDPKDLCDKIVLVDADGYITEYDFYTEEQRRLINNTVELWSVDRAYGSIWTMNSEGAPYLKPVIRLDLNGEVIKVL